MDLLSYADRLWNGEIPSTEYHPIETILGGMAEVALDTVIVSSLANVTAFRTSDGLVLVDTGSLMFARPVHAELRAWTSERLHTAVYSHGHIDHVFGVPVFEEESRTNGWPAPRVVAHENMPARFDRYTMTAGYNGVVNTRQFQTTRISWPTAYRYPDETYRDALTLEVGDERFELHHGKGETDDHTWTWVPARKVLCTGDFFIWATPNCGNPQKVQRYPREWSRALRRMAALGAEVLLPGHGLPLIGADRIVRALTDTAAFLEHLHDETVRLMNEGADLDEIIHTVRPPEGSLEAPYLRPVYDEPEFIVRNVWRLYGGWYEGDPARLKPAPDAEVAAELASLAGGSQRLAQRALELSADGRHRLACHLAELAGLASADDPGVHAARAEVYERRATSETSTMAKGLFAWTASQSRKVSG